MVEEALHTWHRPTTLRVASDDIEATAFLRREGSFANAPRPAFVLLDLNMDSVDLAKLHYGR